MHETYFVKKEEKKDTTAYGVGGVCLYKNVSILTIESVLKNCIPKTYGSFCT